MTLVLKRYSVSTSSPDKSLNSLAGTKRRMVPARPHIEQLQVTAGSDKSSVASNFTFPQWQLPVYVLGSDMAED